MLEVAQPDLLEEQSQTAILGVHVGIPAPVLIFWLRIVNLKLLKNKNQPNFLDVISDCTDVLATFKSSTLPP